jgi:hypothetical protein
VTLLQTNACSPLATNAIRDNIWDNFSSETYKELPSVGTINVDNPVTGEEKSYDMPGGGRGYTRPASLISLWSTAPFLLNNTVGKFNASPSVDARLDSFQDSIEKMLWPENREKDSVLGEKGIGLIDRTTETCYLRVAPGYVPDSLESWGKWFLPRIIDENGITIGPIPRGTPVSLLASLMIRPEESRFWDRLRHRQRILNLVRDINTKLKQIEQLGANPTDAQTQEILKPLADQFMALSKCPDYVVNRGHYFGTGYDNEPALSDDDKRALIEFLKTF